MAKVEFNMENVEKCLCKSCLVQSNSECVKIKMKVIQEKMAEDIDSAIVIEPSDIPGMYCATGKTTCDDLYFHEECKCGECLVFKENDLMSGKPMGYYCRDGKAI
jgi:hypothetical protein